MGKKVYGVIRTGGGEPSVICEVKAKDSLGETVPVPVTKKQAQEFAHEFRTSFSKQGYIYTVFKMKFKETI